MQLELRSTAPAVCHECGSHELLKIVRSIGGPVEPLAATLAVRADLPWYAWLRRRLVASLEESFKEAEDKLIDDARFPFVSEVKDGEAEENRSLVSLG